jgi:hypothetical protein
MDADRDHENPIGPDLTALERRLSAWRPSAGSLDRDRMLYDAGRSAAAGARPWRLMAAPLFLATLGLTALLAHEHSSLGRERALVAQERAQRRQLETALAARTEASQPTSPSPVQQDAPIEPPAPSSYLALTARLTADVDDPAPRHIIDDPERRSPVPAPERGPARPSPFRPHDLRRVLDL